MIPTPSSRRDFLVSAARLLGGGWTASSLPLLTALSACARDAAQRGEPFTTLSPEEGRTLAAFASQILPSDDTPGAEEAGAVYFIDRALESHFAEQRELIREGAADLDRRALALDASVDGFADLAPERQAEVIREVEQTPFFFSARMLTVMGVFADPSYGGNRDGVGWQLAGMEHKAAFQPPFGYYDAEYAREQGATT